MPTYPALCEQGGQGINPYSLVRADGGVRGSCPARHLGKLWKTWV